ncbi:MAG: MmcQ/YjbR family DNA-binding protein [Sneathiella sp.]|nr:MmcQ/YjbR family DNA-binding protein [Sneathiella sp.]
MKIQEFNDYCSSLAATTNVIQWGNASVWKVGGKIFAICSHWGDGIEEKYSFKCSELSFSILIEQEGIIPAPYLARAKWVQLETYGALSDEDMRAYVKNAHDIISKKLTKALQKELGLL